jgi:hypothetical protein
MSQTETIARMAGTSARNALQRVQDIEETVQQVVVNFTQEITKINETCNVLVDMLGREAFEAALTSKRDTADANAVAAQKKALADAVEVGALKVADTIAESSLLVLTEKTADGVPLKWGSRIQIPLGQVKEQFRTQLVGKKVGAVVPTPEGHLFEVAEIYEPQKAPQVPAANEQVK